MALYEKFYDKLEGVITINGTEYRYDPDIMKKKFGFFRALHSDNDLGKGGESEIIKYDGKIVSPHLIGEFFRTIHMELSLWPIILEHFYIYSFFGYDEVKELFSSARPRKVHDLSDDGEVEEYLYLCDLIHVEPDHAYLTFNPDVHPIIIIGNGEFHYYRQVMDEYVKIDKCREIVSDASYRHLQDYLMGCDLTTLDLLSIAHDFKDTRLLWSIDNFVRINFHNLDYSKVLILIDWIKEDKDDHGDEINYVDYYAMAESINKDRLTPLECLKMRVNNESLADALVEQLSD